jgi:hypothetical protein
MLKSIGTIVGIGAAVALAVTSFAQNSAPPVASSFNEVWKVVSETPNIASLQGRDMVEMAGDIELYGTSEEPKLPHHSGTLDVLASIASGAMLQAAKRTVHSSADYRTYFKKLVHANGICFSGLWQITEESGYSGLFEKGASALIIGRVSAASPQTTNNKARSFGFAGKLFPTLNPDEPVATANFFTVHDLNGTEVAHALDVAYTNEPPVNLSGIRNLPLKILNDIFALADKNPGVRPLYPIGQAGLREGAADVTPKWMRIRVASGVQNALVNDADFRNELSARNYPSGLLFTIEVSDTTKDTLSDAGWKKVGQIRTSPMITTFGCDRRLHFDHPKTKKPLTN